MGMKKKSMPPGVRGRERTRRNGKVDIAFFVRYSIDGKQKEEFVGWRSEGMTATLASLKRAELKLAQLDGRVGERTLKEKREKAREAERAERERIEREEAEALTFADVWADYAAKAKERKTAETFRREKSLYRTWIAPALWDMPIRKIDDNHVRAILDNMRAADTSPRSQEYALAVVRQVFGFAKREMKIFEGELPTKGVQKPRFDNKRQRYLKPEEAERLLSALKGRSEEVYRISLVSLHCGLRFSEIARLTWADVDMDAGQLFIRDPKPIKTPRNRYAYMTTRIRDLFEEMDFGLPNQLVFPADTLDKNGYRNKMRTQVPATFKRVVQELGLNDNIDDRRQKFTFHCLRHSFASALVGQGIDLYRVQKLLGHSTISQTERYSHVRNSQLQEAVNSLDEVYK